MTVSRKPRLTVLTLHRVGPGTSVHASHVERCLRFLARYFRVIRPSELDLAASTGRIGLVTVDDGHVDAYRYIFPIAKTMGIPISLCVSTDFFFRRQWLWFDKLKWAMRHARPTAVARFNGMDVRPHELSSCDMLRTSLKRLPPVQRDSAIDELMHGLDLDIPPTPPEECRALTESELREMVASGWVEIVGHTVTHTITTVLAPQELDAELTQAKQEWDSFLPDRLTAFCYPNGEIGDFDERSVAALQRAGYLCAFTSVEGTNPLPLIDPMTLRRVHIHRKPGVCDKLLAGLADVQGSLISGTVSTSA